MRNPYDFGKMLDYGLSFLAASFVVWLALAFVCFFIFSPFFILQIVPIDPAWRVIVAFTISFSMAGTLIRWMQGHPPPSVFVKGDNDGVQN